MVGIVLDRLQKCIIGCEINGNLKPPRRAVGRNRMKYCFVRYNYNIFVFFMLDKCDTLCYCICVIKNIIRREENKDEKQLDGDRK